MNTKQLIKNVAEKTGISDTATKTVVNSFLDEIVSFLGEKHNINIYGFGNFTITQRKSRQGINPRTLEAMTIKAHNTIHFSPSVIIKKAINS